MIKLHRSIYFTKSMFEKFLSEQLNLTKVSSPVFVDAMSGVQDNLSGTERPVRFQALQLEMDNIEIIHSLAKWKRKALAYYQVEPGAGIITNMRAIRPDEADLTSGIHSIYVDQWDWERVIYPEDRTLVFLESIVDKIYAALKSAEAEVERVLGLKAFLPSKIQFIHTEELRKMWPELSPKERENKICQAKGAVFLVGIGGELTDGKKHDLRAPDYDDWSTPNSSGQKGLNGDILVWNPVLNRAFELSSMGIRVDKKALLHQLTLCDELHRQELAWHRALLNDEMPLSIGGGIGQSRLVMLLLQKRHIGEVQVSLWPKAVIETCRREGIHLLA